MSIQIEIDTYACCGHGDCAEVAPQVFAVDGDLATVIGDGPRDLLLRAAESCPSSAILLTAAGGEPVYP